MNLMNVPWAVFALIFGLLFSWMMWAIIAPLMDLMVAQGTSMYYVSQIGLFMFSFVLIVVFPLATAFSNEEGGILKKVITRAKDG